MANGSMLVDSEKLLEAGNSLESAGKDLAQTIDDVKSVVSEIENGAFEGTAADDFVGAFNGIKENLDNFSEWMQTMGKSMVVSAENTSNIDRKGAEAIIK